MCKITDMTLTEKIKYLRKNHPVKVPINIAAQALDASECFVRAGIIQGQLCFGTGVQGEKGRWSFNIPTERFIAYISGADIVSCTKDNLLDNLKEAFDAWLAGKRIEASQAV